MGSLMKKQAEKFLREKKRHRRWLAVFLCLALLVTSGTFAALRMNGQAMDHGDRELDCKLRLHEHTEECCDQEGKLICGKADYVVHTHKSDCYSPEGELVCTLPEREAHVHDSSCYEEQKVLVCEEEETAGHVHGQECYIEEKGEPQCGLGEHEHDWSCYDEYGSAICGQEAHYHDDSCYLPTEVLVCGQEEGAGGHTHTEDCYEAEKVLTCGELELHTHDEETCYDENGVLICGIPELEEHEHGEGCFSTAEETDPVEEEDSEESREQPAASEGSEGAGSLEYEDGQVRVSVKAAEKGIIPKDAQLSVRPIVQQDVEALKADESVSENAVAEAEELNAKYEEVQRGLEAAAAEDMTKEIVGFLAYDISIMENGTEIEPGGEVKVSLDYKEASAPEEVKEIGEEEDPISQIEVIHMKETGGDVTAQKLENVEVALTENAEVQNAEFVTDSFSTFILKWVRTTTTGSGDAQTVISVNAESSIVALERSGNGYQELAKEYQPLPDAQTISSEGTPPTLYMDSIGSTGLNQGLYTLSSNSSSGTAAEGRYFEGGYVGKMMENVAGPYSENDLKLAPIAALQAMQFTSSDTNTTETVIRYLPKGEGEYKRLGADQQIYFIYTGAEGRTTTGSYQTVDGQSLYKRNGNNYSKYEGKFDFTKISTNEAGLPVNGTDLDLEQNLYIKNTAANSYQQAEYAYVIVKDGSSEIRPTFIRYYNSVLQYSVAASDSEEAERAWEDVGTKQILIIYNRTKSGTQSGTITTADTAGIVDINLFDYPDWSRVGDFAFIGYAENTSDGERTSVDVDNGKDPYKDNLRSDSYPWNNAAINTNAGQNGGVYTGIVSSNLSGGYPKLQVGSQTSLEALFDPDNSNGLMTHKDVPTEKSSYIGLNHLFSLSEDGYYSYDSSKNYAYYNKTADSKNFIVYDQKGGYGNRKKDGKLDTDFPYENFTPFVDKDEKATNGKGKFTSYHFGMHISFDFVQPENGEINKQPMTFEFTGDDDVWVFVDDKLVLDMGGCHNKASGKINFKTGDVNLYKVEHGQYSTDDPGVATATITDTQKSLQDVFGELFKANTTHHLDFFYLERGRSLANCSLKFNIQPKTKQNLEIKKEIISTNQANYGDTEFSFKAYLQKEKGSKEYDVIPENTSYTIKEDGNVVGEGHVGENGIFKLKHDQSAIFADIDPELHYYVEEVSVSNKLFDAVTVNDSAVKYQDESGKELSGDALSGDKTYIARSETKTLNDVGKVVFKNSCSYHNKKTLRITKRLADGIEEYCKNDTYAFQIYLENKQGKLVPYTGAYSVISSNGQESGPFTTANGTTEGIPADSRIEIKDILSGTDFYVKEVNLAEKYTVPAQTVSGNCYEAFEEGKEPADLSGGVGGTIVLGEEDTDTTVEVTVTNDLKKDYKIVKRSASNKELLLQGAQFSLTDAKNPSNTYTLSSNYVGELAPVPEETKIPAGTYTLKETKAPDGYTLSDAEWTVTVDSGGKFNKIEGCVPENTVVSTDATGVVATCYFEDTLFYELPSTGGDGIYRYLVSGIFLMMASTLILYKTRRKEVVRK